MSYSLNLPASLDLKLNYCCATIQGPDAAEFLQAQLAANLEELDAGTARWTCWVDARGKVRVIGHVIKISAEHWLFLCTNDFLPALKKLSMFVLRAEVNIGLTPPPPAGMGPLPAESVAVRIDAQRALLHQLPPGTPAATIENWRNIGALRGEAQLPAERCSEEIPQSLGLVAEQGFSLKKGCYPGQEIISRVHYRGHPPRRLVTTIAPVAPEDALYQSPLADTGLWLAQSLRPWKA